MSKTILVTGSTDGIGLETAKALLKQGHRLLIHGRNSNKLDNVKNALSEFGNVEAYQADLSVLTEVEALAQAIKQNHKQLDVLINNAGVFKIADPATTYGLDVRFLVNTLAPYLLTQLLLPLIPDTGRIINLSSAAQAPVDMRALTGDVQLPDFGAYAQSKLALTMWSQNLAQQVKDKGIIVVSVNPGSMLGTKMVQEGFGVSGGDVNIGSGILVRAALSEEFATASGLYYDNDSQQFAPPHSEAAQLQKVNEVVQTIEELLSKYRAVV